MGELKFWPALIGVFIFGALLIGCGGSGGDETIAKQEFVNQANGLCEKAFRQRSVAYRKAANEAEGKKGLDQTSIEAFYVKVILPGLARMADELDELDEPDPGSETATAFIDSLRGAIEKAEAEPEKVFGGSSDPFLEAEKRAKALGLEACSAF